MIRETNQRSTPWTDYKGLSDDVIISRQIKILLSSYRRDDYADPDGFVMQLAALFERQPRNVIVEITNPLNTRSIQRKHPIYPPNIGEVAEAIEAEANEQANIKRLLAVPKPIFRRDYVPPPHHPGSRTNVLIRKDAPQYPKVLEIVESGAMDARDWKHDNEGRGTWLALKILDDIGGGRIKAGRDWQSASAAAVRAKIAADENTARALDKGE